MKLSWNFHEIPQHVTKFATLQWVAVSQATGYFLLSLILYSSVIIAYFPIILAFKFYR